MLRMFLAWPVVINLHCKCEDVTEL